jgi:hypothetical protein
MPSTWSGRADMAWADVAAAKAKAAIAINLIMCLSIYAAAVRAARQAYHVAPARAGAR